MADQKQGCSPGPWSVELGQSANHREGYYVVDAQGRALWDNGGSDGGVCYEESVARLIASVPTLASDLAEAVEALRISTVTLKQAGDIIHQAECGSDEPLSKCDECFVAMSIVADNERLLARLRTRTP